MHPSKQGQGLQCDLISGRHTACSIKLRIRGWDYGSDIHEEQAGYGTLQQTRYQRTILYIRSRLRCLRNRQTESVRMPVVTPKFALLDQDVVPHGLRPTENTLGWKPPGPVQEASQRLCSLSQETQVIIFNLQ